MRFLSIGTQGASVVDLQQKLNMLRFPCGLEDGIFGPATEAAVIAFQKSHNIVYDGIAGPETMTSLDMYTDEDIQAAKEDHPVFNALKNITPGKVSELFPQAPVRTINAHFPIFKEALVENQLTDLKSVVFALSTISAISTSFNVHEETVTRLNTSPGGLPFDLYDHRRDIGNGGHPDGERYKSRGFCIFRGRIQYLQLSTTLGIGDQLIEQPEQVMKVSMASKILARLIQDQEKNIKCALLQNNLQSAYMFVTKDIEGFDRFRVTYRKGMLSWG
jgi:peptidoglycan L-alanyl-D-glutamate endopeptidase CwlK